MSDAPHVSPQLRSSKPAVNVEGFFRAVGDAQKDYLDRFQINEAERPLYTEEWPKERLAEVGKPFDFIGFHVVRSQRASNSNTEYRPANGLTLVETQPSEKEAGYLEENFMWTEEAVVQFTIFSQSNARATDVMQWFVALVLYYAHTKFFFARGVNYLVYQGRLEDTIEKTQNQDLYTRRVQFRIKVQNIFNLEAKTLETFSFNIGLKGGSSTTSISIPATS
jgi:hypothetical protein